MTLIYLLMLVVKSSKFLNRGNYKFISIFITIKLLIIQIYYLYFSIYLEFTDMYYLTIKEIIVLFFYFISP